jgi:hypothetical protein
MQMESDCHRAAYGHAEEIQLPTWNIGDDRPASDKAAADFRNLLADELLAGIDKEEMSMKGEAKPADLFVGWFNYMADTVHDNAVAKG